MNRSRLAVLALAGALSLSALAVPALAQAVAAQPAPAPGAVVVPYGSWIGTYGLEIAGYAVTVLSTVAAAAVARLWPVAASILTQQRLQTAGQAVAEYAVNAIAGATKDGKVQVNLGSAVVAEAVQRGIDVLPSWLMKKAGGPGGLAAIVFRILNFEEGASKANVLDPAIEILRSRGQA